MAVHMITIAAQQAAKQGAKGEGACRTAERQNFATAAAASVGRPDQNPWCPAMATKAKQDPRLKLVLNHAPAVLVNISTPAQHHIRVLYVQTVNIKINN